MKSKSFTMSYKIDEKSLSNLLSDARGDTCGVAWWKEENESDYEAARQELIDEGIKEPCLEDVWARMMFNGKKLMLLDPESDWHWKGHEEGELLWNWQIAAEETEPEGGEWHLVGLDEIIEGLKKYFKEKPASGCGDLKSLIEEGDFWDADCVIQYAMYGEVIYG